MRNRMTTKRSGATQASRSVIKNVIKLVLLVVGIFFVGYMVFTWVRMRG